MRRKERKKKRRTKSTNTSNLKSSQNIVLKPKLKNKQAPNHHPEKRRRLCTDLKPNKQHRLMTRSKSLGQVRRLLETLMKTLMRLSTNKSWMKQSNRAISKAIITMHKSQLSKLRMQSLPMIISSTSISTMRNLRPLLVLLSPKLMLITLKLKHHLPQTSP